MTRTEAAGTPRRLVVPALVALIAALGAAVLWRASAQDRAGASGDDGKADREHPIVTAARIVELDGRRLIRLDAQALRRAGIRTEPVRPGGQAETLDAFASVADLQSLAQHAAALATARAQVQAALARLSASRNEADRLEHLYEQDQTASASQAQAAQAAFRGDEAALASAQAQADGERAALRLEWGEGFAGAVEVAGNPLHGLVDDLLARRRVLVQVVLPPGMAGRSVPARGSLQLDEGRDAALQFVAMAPRPDPRLAGRAFLYAAQAQPALAPGATYRALLPTGRTTSAAPVPAAAIVWWQGRAWIFVRHGEGDFERREVSVDLAGDRPASAAGLAAGDELVVQGAQVLLSEELRAENFSTDVGGR